MGGISSGIVINTAGPQSLEEIKRKIYHFLYNTYGDYDDADWEDNRIYLQVSKSGIAIQNQDLREVLFQSSITQLERNIAGEFPGTDICAFYVNNNDSLSSRGFSLTNSELTAKRVWYVTETDGKNEGPPLPEESGVEAEGERNVISDVADRIFRNRHQYDFSSVEFVDWKNVESDDFPIEKLYFDFSE